MESMETAARHYAIVERAIVWLNEHAAEQPSLSRLAQAVGLSDSRLQRVFSDWAGVSPKRFVQFLTLGHARRLLAAGRPVDTTALAVGLSGSSRLHDLIVQHEALTPGELRRGAAGVPVGWGLAATPFGEALLAWTPRGLGYLAFVDDTPAASLAGCQARWPQAVWHEDAATAAGWARRVFAPRAADGPLPVLLRGSRFQLKVWEALLGIAPGQRLSYGMLAQQLGQPGAARAVGSAVAANTLAVLVPCPRVIRDTGVLGQYRWGSTRKAALLVRESAAAQAELSD